MSVQATGWDDVAEGYNSNTAGGSDGGRDAKDGRGGRLLWCQLKDRWQAVDTDGNGRNEAL